MDVLELPRPVINFLRTISKEMSRYSLCWDIYGGSESVTLTLTWKINCDESDDEQMAKSRRQHQQQLNNLINMDLNSNIFTDNISAVSNQKVKTPTTPTNQSNKKQLQHSKLDKLTNQSNNCLFSKINKNEPLISSDSYDPYVDLKKSRNQLMQQAKLVPRNYSAESKFIEEDNNTTTLSNKQHKSRRPKSNNHSLERANHVITNKNENIYLDFNSRNQNYDDNDDEDEIYDKQQMKHVYPKKILKYTRGKSLENFDQVNEINANPYDNFDQQKYCHNCNHGNPVPHNNKQYNPQYQNNQFIPRSDQHYYQHHKQHPNNHYPPQQQPHNQQNYNSNLIKISSNTTNNNNEKVCLNNQRLVLDNFNPYQNFPYQQQASAAPPPQHYMQTQSKPHNYMHQEIIDSTVEPIYNKNFKTTKQKSVPPSNDLNNINNRVVFSQTAMSKGTFSHKNNSSNTDNNSDSSSSESIPKKTLPETICINSSSTQFGNMTSSNNKNQAGANSNAVNPWIRRNYLSETKENIVSESTFSKTSTMNEITGTSYESNANNSSINTNADYYPSNNISLPILTSNSKNSQNTSGNTSNTNTNSMHRVTFDPKLDNK